MAPKITFCTGCLSCLDLSQRLAPISPPHVWANANRSSRSARSRLSFANAPAGGSCGTRSHSYRLWRRPLRWVCTPTRSATGDSDGPKVTSAGTRSRDGGATPVFPPGPRAGHGHRGLRSRHAPRKRGATRSVEAVCGGCWQPMPANRGGTRTGSCLGILTSPKRLDHCWTCRWAPGKAQPWAPRTLSAVPTPRRASRPESAATQRCPPGTYAGGTCWDVVHRRPALRPLAGWFTTCGRQTIACCRPPVLDRGPWLVAPGQTRHAPGAAGRLPQPGGPSPGPRQVAESGGDRRLAHPTDGPDAPRLG